MKEDQDARRDKPKGLEKSLYLQITLPSIALITIGSISLAIAITMIFGTPSISLAALQVCMVIFFISLGFYCGKYQIKVALELAEKGIYTWTSLKWRACYKDMQKAKSNGTSQLLWLIYGLATLVVLILTVTCHTAVWFISVLTFPLGLGIAIRIWVRKLKRKVC